MTDQERARELLAAAHDARKAHVAAVAAYNARLEAEKVAGHWPPRMDDLYQKMSAAERAWYAAFQAVTDADALSLNRDGVIEEELWNALKARCASDPEKAKRLVMVSRDDLQAAFAEALKHPSPERQDDE